MSYVSLPDAPGILALFQFKPTLAIPLNALANELLRGPSPLNMGQRELIAAYVSKLNRTEFCYSSHAHVAAVHLDTPFQRIDELLSDIDQLEPLIQALLVIAGKVADRSAPVSLETLRRAREVGATDEMIHDTIAIAAAFCMFNRYVDGLNTEPAASRADYEKMGKHLAQNGYGVLPGQVFPRATDTQEMPLLDAR
jgi:uncharacterized peroxidase-related enzyme